MPERKRRTVTKAETGKRESEALTRAAEFFALREAATRSRAIGLQERLHSQGIRLSSRLHLCDKVFERFRHGESQWIEASLRDSSMRLLRYDSYRDTVQFEGPIGDDREGVCTREGRIKLAWNDGEGLHGSDDRSLELVNQIADFGNAKDVVFQNNRVLNKRRGSPPALVWCLSRVGSNATAMSETYDATLRIRVTTDLLNEIRLGLERAEVDVTSVEFGDIKYVPDRHLAEDSPHWHVSPALIKDVSYQDQRESRIMAFYRGSLPEGDRVTIDGIPWERFAERVARN